MKTKLLLILTVAFCFLSACSTKPQPQEDRHGNYVIKDNMIVFDEPQRQEGQKSVLQFAVDPIENVRIGFIGLGMRGPDAVDRMTYIDGVTVVATATTNSSALVQGGYFPNCAPHMTMQDGPGRVVWRDCLYPGWKADNLPADIMR